MDPNDLKAFELFSGLDDDQLEQCAELFSEERGLMGDRFTAEDDHSYSFFLVLEGSVEVTADGEHLATLGPGDHFGEVGLVRGERRNADVKATAACRVAKLMTWDFEALTGTHPALAERIRAVAEERWR